MKKISGKYMCNGILKEKIENSRFQIFFYRIMRIMNKKKKNNLVSTMSSIS